MSMQRRPSVRPAPLPPPFISLAAPVPRVYPQTESSSVHLPGSLKNQTVDRSPWPSRAPLAAIAASLLLLPPGAQAGMSMPTLTQVASARLDVISFFLVAYFVLAFIYQRLWNSLARDLPKLPRLSYRGALCGLIVCGLFVYVVLTMISGARELMTPGAWARTGTMYAIPEPEKNAEVWLDSARRASLERLRTALWKFAEDHNGEFPSSRKTAGFPEGSWRSIDPNGLPLAYFPGAKRDAGRTVVVYEPGTFGAHRFVLLSNGEIVKMNAADLSEQLQKMITVIP
jgi:hypothetical protein